MNLAQPASFVNTPTHEIYLSSPGSLALPNNPRTLAESARVPGSSGTHNYHHILKLPKLNNILRGRHPGTLQIQKKVPEEKLPPNLQNPPTETYMMSANNGRRKQPILQSNVIHTRTESKKFIFISVQL